MILIPDIPSLYTATVVLLVFGFGYIGVGIKYAISEKNFYKISVFDKTLQSFIVGALSFIVTSLFSNIPSLILLNEASLSKLILENPLIFVYQIVFIVYFSLVWISLERLLEKHKEKIRSLFYQ